MDSTRHQGILGGTQSVGSNAIQSSMINDAGALRQGLMVALDQIRAIQDKIFGSQPRPAAVNSPGVAEELPSVHRNLAVSHKLLMELEGELQSIDNRL